MDRGALSEYQFAKIAKRIKAKTGVDMHLVDATVSKFKELYKKWKEDPVYAVFHSSKFRNSRYGIVLDGPAIYFFRGGDVKLTSYAVQHELLHVKLWYALVKAKGAKGGELIYNRIPRWLHEADVIGELLKQNKLKPGKWPVEEIALDFEDMMAKWSNSIEKHFGKKIELKDLENWDISKHLTKSIK